MDSLSTRNGPASPANSPRGLAAGTLVTTPDGDRKIEEIKAGDLVLSGVGDSFSRHHKVAKVALKHYFGPMLRVTAESGDEFLTTPNHICFAYSYHDDKYAEGSVVICAFDSYDVIKGSMHKVYSRPDQIPTKSLDEAEEVAIKFSRSKGGAEIIRLFMDINEDLYDAGYQFMPAFELKVGMSILFAQEFTVTPFSITNITAEKYDGLIYNLDIPEARNFAANGVLVHDSPS